MAYTSIKNRIKRLEAPHRQAFSDIMPLIERHYKYDELTDEQRTSYCRYIGVERAIFEEVNILMFGDNAVYLRKITPPTEAELREIVREVEEIVNNFPFSQEGKEGEAHEGKHIKTPGRP